MVKLLATLSAINFYDEETTKIVASAIGDLLEDEEIELDMKLIRRI